MIQTVLWVVHRVLRQALTEPWKFEMEVEIEECSLQYLGQKLIDACEHREDYRHHKAAELAIETILLELRRRELRRNEYLARQRELVAEAKAQAASEIWLAAVKPKGHA